MAKKRRPVPGPFDKTALTEGLHRVLGDKADAVLEDVLPYLELYRAMRESEGTRALRRADLERVRDALQDAANAIAVANPSTFEHARRTAAEPPSVLGAWTRARAIEANPAIAPLLFQDSPTVRDAMVAAGLACEYALRALENAPELRRRAGRPPNWPRWALAAVTAVALKNAGVPLGKSSRSGKFRATLECVFDAVNTTDKVPDVGAYVRAFADMPPPLPLSSLKRTP